MAMATTLAVWVLTSRRDCLVAVAVFLVSSSVYTAVVNSRLAALDPSMDLAVFAIINGYVVYVLRLFVAAFSYATHVLRAISSRRGIWLGKPSRVFLPQKLDPQLAEENRRCGNRIF